MYMYIHEFFGKHEFFGSQGDLSMYEWVHKCADNMHAFKRKCIDVCSTPEYNVLEAWASTKSRACIESVHPCAACGKLLKSKQAIAVHNFKAHGCNRALKCHVSANSVCCACMQYFHTHERLLNHLTDRSVRCNMYYMTYLVPINDTSCEPTIKQNRDKANDEIKTLLNGGWRRNKAIGASFRVPGPLTLHAELCCIDHKLGLKCSW